jgi:acyl carrier protein
MPANVVFMVKQILSDHIEVPDNDDAPLQLESLILVMVAEQLEWRFGFRVGARDVVPENFGSVSAIVRYVESRAK